MVEDLTFVIPTYNRAEILENDIRNGLKFGNISKILIDDCSNEYNKNILQSILNKKEKFNIKEFIENKNNKGVAYSRNIAIDSVNTKFIGFIDDDDCLISLDNNYELNNYIDELDKDIIIIIPRYVFNLYENGEVNIGYDRNKFENLKASEVLKFFATTGEMELFNNGAIYKSDIIKENKPNEIFKISEDYVMLSRVLGNNLDKRIKIIQSSFLIRRRSDESLSALLNEEKIFMHLISIIVSSYYCLKNDIISKEEFFNSFRERYILLQNIYGIGENIGVIIENYLINNIGINNFSNQIKNIIKDINFEDLPHEFFEITKYI